MRPPPEPVRQSLQRPSLRRTRSFLLKVSREIFLLCCLAGALACLAGILLCLSPNLSGDVSAWINRELVRQPIAHFARLDQLSREKDPAATVAAARVFLDSVSVPHPSDTFSDRYRSALRIMTTAAETAGDLEARLEAGARAFAFDPNDSTLLLHYGRALVDAQKPELALPPLESAFQIRPNAAQILETLKTVLAETSPSRAAAAERRYHEALALTMVLPKWMTCDLVASSPAASVATSPKLSLTTDTATALDLEFSPANVYLVLPKIPELELLIREARLVAPDGTSVDLAVQPQSQLQVQPDGFIRISPPAGSIDFEQSAVINLALPATVPPRSRLIVRISSRPSPAVQAALESFGTWRHPGVRGFTSN